MTLMAIILNKIGHKKDKVRKSSRNKKMLSFLFSDDFLEFVQY